MNSKTDIGIEDIPYGTLLEFLAANLRLRFEPGRNRMDMHDVMHLELKLPARDRKGKLTGDKCWTSISVTDLKEI